MAAYSLAQVRPHPGKAADVISLMKEVKQLYAKHGLQGRWRCFARSGTNIGVFSMVGEATDLAALATAFQNYLADPAVPPLQDRLYGANGVATLVSFSNAIEVPL